MPAHRPNATTPEELLRRAFDAFDRRDADELMTLVTDDVAWSSDGGMLNKDDLRSCFTLGELTELAAHSAIGQADRRASS